MCDIGDLKSEKVIVDMCILYCGQLSMFCSTSKFNIHDMYFQLRIKSLVGAIEIASLRENLTFMELNMLSNIYRIDRYVVSMPETKFHLQVPCNHFLATCNAFVFSINLPHRPPLAFAIASHSSLLACVWIHNRAAIATRSARENTSPKK